MCMCSCKGIVVYVFYYIYTIISKLRVYYMHVITFQTSEGQLYERHWMSSRFERQ